MALRYGGAAEAMSNIDRAQHLLPGEYITVTRGVQLGGIMASLGSDGWLSPTGRNISEEKRYDRSWTGNILKVLAVNLPIVVVLNERDKYGIKEGKRHTLNLKEIEWMTLTDDFVREALGDE